MGHLQAGGQGPGIAPILLRAQRLWALQLCLGSHLGNTRWPTGKPSCSPSLRWGPHLSVASGPPSPPWHTHTSLAHSPLPSQAIAHSRSCTASLPTHIPPLRIPRVLPFVSHFSLPGFLLPLLPRPALGPSLCGQWVYLSCAFPGPSWWWCKCRAHTPLREHPRVEFLCPLHAAPERGGR